MSPDEIRKKILKALYKLDRENRGVPVNVARVFNETGLADEGEFFVELGYLEKKGLIRGERFGGGRVGEAAITSDGMDYLFPPHEPSSDDDRIRRRMLDVLYEFRRGKPGRAMDLDEFRGRFSDISENDFILIFEHLLDYRLIKHEGVGGVNITSDGINFINKSRSGQPALDIEVVDIAIDNFLANMERVVTQSDMPDEKKESLLDDLGRLKSNPLFPVAKGIAADMTKEHVKEHLRKLGMEMSS
jgi:hypothetical protein